jgi:hypothetical protein
MKADDLITVTYLLFPYISIYISLYYMSMATFHHIPWLRRHRGSPHIQTPLAKATRTSGPGGPGSDDHSHIIWIYPMDILRLSLITFYWYLSMIVIDDLYKYIIHIHILYIYLRGDGFGWIPMDGWTPKGHLFQEPLRRLLLERSSGAAQHFWPVFRFHNFCKGLVAIKSTVIQNSQSHSRLKSYDCWWLLDLTP